MTWVHLQRAAELPTLGTTVFQRCAGLVVAYLLIGLYLWAIVARQAPGLVRISLSLPVLICNVAISPAIFSIKEDILARTSMIFIISWLCSFKVRMHWGVCRVVAANGSWALEHEAHLY